MLKAKWAFCINWHLSVPPSPVVIMLSWTFHIHVPIFSCKTTLPNGTKLDCDVGRGDSDLYVSRNRNGNVIVFCMEYSISWEIKIQCCINYENTKVYQVRDLSVQDLIYQQVILGIVQEITFIECVMEMQMYGLNHHFDILIQTWTIEDCWCLWSPGVQNLS